MKNVFFIILLSILVASCKKENSDSFTPYSNNPLNDTVWVDQPTSAAAVNRLQEIFATSSTSESIEIAAGATLKISEFLEMTLPPFFAKPSTSSTISGRVNVEILFLRKKGDFIRFDRPTTSYGKLLESGGAFYIRITKEGQDLIPDAGKSILIRMRDEKPLNDMKVFYGEHNLQTPLPVGTNPSFTWVQAKDTASNVRVFTRQDPSGVYTGYELLTTKFNWVNCDRFIDSTLPKTKVSVVLPPNYTNTNTSVYAVFKDQKIVVRLNAESLTRTYFAVNMPIGKKITLVSISKIGDDLYLGTKDPTIEANLRLSFTPEKKSKAQIDQFLDGL